MSKGNRKNEWWERADLEELDKWITDTFPRSVANAYFDVINDRKVNDIMTLRQAALDFADEYIELFQQLRKKIVALPLIINMEEVEVIDMRSAILMTEPDHPELLKTRVDTGDDIDTTIEEERSKW